MTEAYIAVDYGGGSGRVIAGTILPDGGLRMTEIHRFGNRQIYLGHHLYWDFLSLYEEMITGLRKAVERGFLIKSIGIDTWGVDFGLIDEAGNLLSNPICYRDGATAPYPGRLAEIRGGAGRHYAEAGIQIMEINSVYRLMSIADEQPGLLRIADKLLFMPDLFSYFLTGEANSEYSIASTSELLIAGRGEWNYDLIDKLKLPRHIFAPIVMPGTVRGYLTTDLRTKLGIDYEVPVVAVGSHDTASAVYASSAKTDSSGVTAFLSSGTWSLLGCLTDRPILTEAARIAGFTNEGSADRRITFLQNITGLWILQRLMSEWDNKGIGIDYPTLVSESEKSTYSQIIDVEDPVFANPPSMSVAISEWLSSRGIEAPATQGDTGRCVMLSLADRYRRGIYSIGEIIGRPVTRLNIIGGGSRNELLNRMTAEATGIEVIAGPVEATGIGSILLQAKTLGDISSPESVTSVTAD